MTIQSSTVGTIGHYDLPTENEFPTNVVPWKLDAQRAGLLVHDMQRYFLAMFESSETRTTLATHVAALIEAARASGVPIFYTAQPGAMSRTERGLLADFWGSGMTATSEQRSIVDVCAPSATDTMITKWRYSAFVRNDFHDQLAAAGVDQLIVCGVFASIGCLATAVDAYSHDIETFMVGDAVADFQRDDHILALDWVARRCGAVKSTAAVVDDLCTSGDRTDTGRSVTSRAVTSQPVTSQAVTSQQVTSQQGEIS